jgi:hypothetical protein
VIDLAQAARSADRARAQQAALVVRGLYPGPVGETLYRELRAFIDMGYRFEGKGLIARLADQIIEKHREQKEKDHGAEPDVAAWQC